MIRFVVPVAIAMTLCGTTASPHQQEDKKGADDSNSGIIFGRDHSFSLTAPAGWVLDNASGVPQGLQAVFYPKGSSWKDSASVMYAGVTRKEKASFAKVVQDDVARFKEGSPKTTVADLPSLLTHDKKKAVVKCFFDAKHDNHEAVAYIDEAKVVVLLTLSCRSQEELDKSMSAHKELIASYRFLTDKVKIK
jgi:hypothetical protein